MEICFEGIGQTAATFRAEGEIRPGMAVTLVKSGTVGPGEDGDAPCGVALGSARGGAVAVQMGGAAKAGYSGSAPAAGWQNLACDGQGGVKAADAGGVRYLVLAVDTQAKTVTVKL